MRPSAAGPVSAASSSHIYLLSSLAEGVPPALPHFADVAIQPPRPLGRGIVVVHNFKESKMAGGKRAEQRRYRDARHIRLPHSVTGSDAWRDLSGNAIKVLVALLRFDKGGDNGELFLSVRMAAKETGLAENTAWRALRDLEEHGFIAVTDRGHFNRKHRPATQWRITWQPAQGKAATRDFERWRPCGKKARSQNLKETVATSITAEETSALPVANFATGGTEKSRVSSSDAAAKNGTQLVCQGHSEHRAENETRKKRQQGIGWLYDLPPSATDAAIRERALAVLDGAPAGSQSRLAAAAKMPNGTLSKFLRNGRRLPEPHRANLSLALAALEAAEGAAEGMA